MRDSALEPGDLVEPQPPGCLVYETRGSARSRSAWMIDQGIGMVLSVGGMAQDGWISRVEVVLPTGEVGWCYISSLAVLPGPAGHFDESCNHSKAMVY